MRGVLVAATSYGLTLTVASDGFYLFAIPGVMGLLIVTFLVVRPVMCRSFAGAEVPFATDGTERRGAVTYHYGAVVKRYVAILSAGVGVVALPMLVTYTYLFPLVGMGMMSILWGTMFWVDQMRWIRKCSRVLNVYSFEFRAPVQKLSMQHGARRILRVGGEGSDLPKMSARATVGQEEWPTNIADGVWFAGDDLFGGVLLVPGSGELMCMQPLDWGAFARARQTAGGERQSMARQAGLDRQSM